MESVCGTRCMGALNMAQIEKLDKLQAILSTQVAIETRTRNNYEQIHKI
jgi:hypothetical protein